MQSYKARFQMMGTFIDLVVYHPMGEKLIQESYSRLQRFSQRFTVNQPHSELMTVNDNAGVRPVRVQADMYDLIKKARGISLDTNNPFNVAIGPLVKAWRIGFKDARLPTEEEIIEKQKIIEPSNIFLDDQYQTVFLSKQGMQIDLGAIAKGYFADRIKEYLVSEGVEFGYINLGGNVQTIGYSPENPAKAWNVGIQDPLSCRGDVCHVVQLNDCSMVTSGINERYFETDGQQYHHLLDSKTGRPIITTIASVTIIAKQSTDCEIWSTAGFLATVEDSVSYLNKQKDIEAIVISNEGKMYTTQGFNTSVLLTGE